MIDTYRSLAVFDAVASAGSFSAAARQLRLSTSVVSHHISKLEQRLGVALFYRSTRSLSLTPEGVKIREAAAKIVHAGAEVLDLLAEDSDQPIGALRITVPAFGGHEDVQAKVWEFARAYPLVAVSISSSDRPVDLIKEGFDLAIRLGRLADSSLKSRKVGTFQRTLVASAEYIARRGPVETFDDLRACDFVSFSMLSDDVTLIKAGETMTFTPENIRIEVDSVAAAKSAICQGLGLQRLPSSQVAAEVENGSLVEILPQWRPPELGVYVVWPAGGPEKRVTRLFVDFLAGKGARANE